MTSTDYVIGLLWVITNNQNWTIFLAKCYLVEFSIIYPNIYTNSLTHTHTHTHITWSMIIQTFPFGNLGWNVFLCLLSIKRGWERRRKWNKVEWNKTIDQGYYYYYKYTNIHTHKHILWCHTFPIVIIWDKSFFLFIFI